MATLFNSCTHCTILALQLTKIFLLHQISDLVLGLFVTFSASGIPNPHSVGFKSTPDSVPHSVGACMLALNLGLKSH